MRYALYRPCLTLLLFLSACAPSLGTHISVPTIPEPQAVLEGSTGAQSVRVKVGSFRDARSSPTIVAIDGRDVESEGELAAVVEEGFARYLRDAGARIAILNAPTVEGEITEWRARVSPSFPTSDAAAFARLKVTVRDTSAQPIYYATFSGEATASHPLLDEEHVQKLLAQAMGSALEAAVRDEKFVAQLARGRAE